MTMDAQELKSIFGMTTPMLIAHHNELAAALGMPLIKTWTGDHALLCQGVTLLRMIEPTRAAPSIKPQA
jgi:hypothetical protein